MAKLTAWLVTLIGALLVLSALGTVSLSDPWVTWVVALAVLVVGLGKLMRNYSSKRR